MRFNPWKLDYIGLKKYSYGISLALVVVSLLSVAIFGLNYGIDFRSGTTVDVALSQPVDKEAVERFLDAGQSQWGEYVLTPGTERLSIRFKDVLSGEQQTSFREAFRSELDAGASFEMYVVGVDIAREQQEKALWGVLFASVGILIYVAIRFEWRFGLAAIIALLHDAIVVVGAFSLFRLEVNMPFIVAVLTIIGYSINDTVVIFDRIRENLRFAKIKTHADLANVVNTSVRQTLTRSINTVVTVLIGAVLLFALGSPSIRLFSLAIIIGLVAGTYSSIFVASPLWYELRKRMKAKKPAKAAAAS
ncbi:MAG TPA: protein translocase subunit SecF [Paenibacillaceae bacterium]